MKKISTICFLLLFSHAALADVSKLLPIKGNKPVVIRQYDVMILEVLSNGVEIKEKDDAKRQAKQQAANEAASDFSARLLEKLSQAQAFKQVVSMDDAHANAADQKNALVLSGTLTDFHGGNLATRYIGLGARSKFAAELLLKRASDGQEIGKIKIKFASGFLPGVTNLVKSTDRFIAGAASRVVDELLIAKGVKHREETGRSGRLREKYTN